jgi:peptidoglycan/LPS O-acetylase OafA/YrhL
MTDKRHYLEMDGLRGVAALSVAMFHLQSYFGGYSFFGHGYLAVDFFFMLSGFVLMHAYGARLAEKGSFPPYLRDRVIRLYPMLLVGAGIGFIFACVARGETSRSLPAIVATSAANGLGLPALWSKNPFWINAPTWSLFFEMAASVSFGLLAYLITTRRLLVVAGLSAVLMLALNYHVGLFGFGWTRNMIVAGFVRVCASFTIGLILQRLHSSGVLANGGKRWWIAPVLVASFVLLPTYSEPSIFYDPLVVFGLYPVLILASAGSQALIPSVAKLSGALSYPFYVVHVPLLSLIRYFLATAGVVANGWTALGSLVVAGAISWVLLHYYDEPVRAYLRHRYGSRNHRS